MNAGSKSAGRGRPPLPLVIPARMPRWQLRGLYAATAALVFTGIGWLLLHYFGSIENEFGPSSNPFEHPTLAVHGAAAMAFLILLGSLLPVHVLRGWHQRRNLVSGFILTAVNLLLIFSGCGLYYIAGDQLRAVLSATHWLVGLTLAALLIWHIVVGRSGRRR